MGLYKRKDSRHWWMAFKANGRHVCESTKTGNKKLAEKIYAKRLMEIVEGAWFPSEIRKRTLRDMIDRYESEFTSKKKFQARDGSIFKHLRSFFGDNTLLRDIEASIGEYEGHRASQGAVPGTIVKELGLLRRMFNIARKKWRWVRDNPVSYIEMPRVNNERVRYLSQDEYGRLFRSLGRGDVPGWLRPIVVLALNTGLRESNLLNLRWAQVNLSSRLIIIEGAELKNGESIGLPLTKEAVETLKGLREVRQIEDLVFHDNGERIYARKLIRAFGKACEIAGIENFHFHDLRHTFASYLRQRGVDLHTISKLLGHKDIRMTQRYSHLSVEHLRNAISVLENKPAHYVFTTFEGDEGVTEAVTP